MPTSTMLSRLRWHCNTATALLLILPSSKSLRQIPLSILRYIWACHTQSHMFPLATIAIPSTHPDLQNSESAASQPVDIQHRKPWLSQAKLSHSVRQPNAINSHLLELTVWSLCYQIQKSCTSVCASVMYCYYSTKTVIRKCVKTMSSYTKALLRWKPNNTTASRKTRQQSTEKRSQNSNQKKTQQQKSNTSNL